MRYPLSYRQCKVNDNKVLGIEFESLPLCENKVKRD